MREEHIIIRTIDTADFGQAMEFAGNGMNFDRYTSNGLALRLYTRSALYEAVLKSTTMLGAYRGDATAYALVSVCSLVISHLASCESS